MLKNYTNMMKTSAPIVVDCLWKEKVLMVDLLDVIIFQNANTLEMNKNQKSKEKYRLNRIIHFR